MAFKFLHLQGGWLDMPGFRDGDNGRLRQESKFLVSLFGQMYFNGPGPPYRSLRSNGSLCGEFGPGQRVGQDAASLFLCTLITSLFALPVSWDTGQNTPPG